MSGPAVDLLPGHLQDDLANRFARAVASIAEETGIPGEAVDISEHGLALALRECRKDLFAMLARRRVPNSTKFKGLSLGKLAGVLVFRLARYRTVHVFADNLPDDKRIRKIADKLLELAALRFVCESILKIKPQKWHPELLYIVARRHTNQEMLGVTFDVLSAYCPTMKTKTSLDEAPFNRLFHPPSD